MMDDDLLDIAERLARFEERRPRRTSLRRAVSSAYYALFHALARLCADQLVGWREPWEVYSPIYRTVDHGRSKEVFRRISGRRRGPISVIGETFLLLQERRQQADYDPSPFPFGRAETIDLIEQTKEAVTLLNSLPSSDRLFIATQLIARTRT